MPNLIEPALDLEIQELQVGNCVYLKEAAKIELLVGGWCAWPHLIAPLQRALNFKKRYIPLLESFLQNPRVHIAAAKDPSLFGGPFVDVPFERLDEASALLGAIRGDMALLLEVADAFTTLQQRLEQVAVGAGLAQVYETLDPRLHGLVEVVYDLNNRASVKTREELFYRLDACRSGEAIALTDRSEADRGFFMSRPRLPDDDCLLLQVGFDHGLVDLLSRARYSPVPRRDISDALATLGAPDEAISRFLTSRPPRRLAPAFDEGGVRVRYFGHASVLLQTRETSVLIDPTFAFDRNLPGASLTFADLPDFIDVVVLTHAHQDHFAIDTLVQLRGRIGRVLTPRNNPGELADPSLKLALLHAGFLNVTTVEPFEAFDIPGGRIKNLPFPGEHCDLDIAAKQCPLIEMAGHKFLFLVDSDAADPGLYERIRNDVGEVDTIFIGMECHGAPLTWLYGPLLVRQPSRRDDESRRLSGADCDRALAVIRRLNPKHVFVYAMGLEPWMRHVMGPEYTPTSIQIRESDRFLEVLAADGVAAERLNGCKEWFYA